MVHSHRNSEASGFPQMGAWLYVLTGSIEDGRHGGLLGGGLGLLGGGGSSLLGNSTVRSLGSSLGGMLTGGTSSPGAQSLLSDAFNTGSSLGSGFNF